MALIQNKLFQMRVSSKFVAMVDKWQRAQPNLPPRAEAVRRLVEAGVTATKKPKGDQNA
jgi:hypothetical protein